MRKNPAFLPTALAVAALTAALTTACSALASNEDAASPSATAESDQPSGGDSLQEELDRLKEDYSTMSLEYDAYRESCEASQAESRAAAESSAAARQEAVDRIGYETGITYRQLMGASELFQGMKVKFQGKVLQVIQDSESIQLRLAVDGDMDTAVFGEYDTNQVPIRPSKDANITIYGTAIGLFSYQSTTGKDQTIPSISIENITQP